MNILGIGIDIIEIHRIKKAVERNNSFLSRLFREEEVAYFKLKKLNYETIAGSFAAKEAISKAIGTGFSQFKFKDIEILRDKKGRPYVKAHDNLLQLINKMRIEEIKISISHCKDYATANAIAISTNKSD